MITAAMAVHKVPKLSFACDLGHMRTALVQKGPRLMGPYGFGTFCTRARL
jgi:hypothetical protein